MAKRYTSNDSNSRIHEQRGSAFIGGGSNPTQRFISFTVGGGTTFSSTPRVVASARLALGTGFFDTFALCVIDVGTTGFSITINRTDSTSWGNFLWIDWIAWTGGNG